MFGEKSFGILDLRSVDLLNTARVRANILPLEPEVFLAQKVSKLLKLFVVWLTFIVDEVFFSGTNRGYLVLVRKFNSFHMIP